MKNGKINLEISIFVLVFVFSFLIFNHIPTNAQVNGIDLAPEALFWSPAGSIKQGNNIFVGVRVKNLGTVSADSFRIMLTYNGFFLCSYDVLKLNPNEIFERGPGLTGASLSNNCAIYSVAPPGYTIKVVVDDLGRIAEINKNNNTTSAYLTVIPSETGSTESLTPGAYIPVGLPTVPVVPQPITTQNQQPITSQNQQQSSPNIGNFNFLNGLVPCGTALRNHACTICDFFVLIQNIINFFLYLMIPLVTIAAVYIAFIFMTSGGSSSKISDAKSKLWLVILGIFWILGSWLVISTILNIVAGSKLEDRNVFPWPWNQINCQVSQPATNTTGSPSVNAPGFTTNDEYVLPEVSIARLDQVGSYEDGVQTNTSGYAAVDAEHYGLEQVEPAAPYTANDPTSPVVDQEVQQIVNEGISQQAMSPQETLPPPLNGVDPNLVKAIIQAESSGNKNAIHVDKDGKASYGLMQVRPDTAKRYDSSLANLSDAQIGEKLKDPDYNMGIGTAYLQDLAAKYSGDLNKVIAAYNGGPGANKPSVNCPGSMRWQCQWDNNAQTIPNTGYAVTRNYVTKVSNYYSQLSK